MIWLWMLVLALLAMVPLGFALRTKGSLQNRRDAALALHQSQLDEIERDRLDGRLPEAEYRAAKLEVQRRLLATDAIAEAQTGGSARGLLVAALVLVPVVGFVLFLPGSVPFVPSEPHASWVKQQNAMAVRDNHLIAALRARLARLPPDSPQAREGYVILGQALVERGQLAQAAQAWRVALRAKFEPGLAAEAAEAETEAAGHVTAKAKALFQRALAVGPQDAAWRHLARQRLREASAALPKAPGDSTSSP
jgi:cytochrome c-type biogenesis protein CcmH